MSWFKETLSSSIGRKVLMSLTGLFLCSFLVIHAAGNLQLFKGDDGQAFNEYTKFMTSSILIKTISYLLYISILLHVIDGFLLIARNKKARPVGYEMWKASDNSMWASRNMGILGTLILIFLVVHLRAFWWEYHFGEINTVIYNGEEYRDMYSVVIFAYKQWYYSLFYVLMMIPLGFHLLHGFRSGFQTLGLRHKKYTPFVEGFGIIFSIVIPAAFAAMPIYLFLSQL
ncbi:MAG TPA: succinate dehydrogenase cytochrome b subunit [Cytophagales bacterium]|nr:succinate dehydrogenase cytochrome b subunit [Cytophagales bacterium]